MGRIKDNTRRRRTQTAKHLSKFIWGIQHPHNAFHILALHVFFHSRGVREGADQHDLAPSLCFLTNRRITLALLNDMERVVPDDHLRQVFLHHPRNAHVPLRFNAPWDHLRIERGPRGRKFYTLEELVESGRRAKLRQPTLDASGGHVLRRQLRPSKDRQPDLGVVTPRRTFDGFIPVAQVDGEQRIRQFEFFRLRNRVDKSFFDRHVTQVTARKMGWRLACRSGLVLHQVLPHRAGGPDQLHIERVHPERLRHLLHRRVDAPVSRLTPGILDRLGREVEIPLPFFTFSNPASARHVKPLLD